MAAVRSLTIQELQRRFCRSGLIIRQLTTLLFGRNTTSPLRSRHRSLSMRLLLGALRLYVYRALWYWLGITAAGRALIKALGSPDENIRSIAGILLVKSGKRAEALLLEAANRRENLPTVLTALGSIGDPAFIPQLRPFTNDPNQDVAKAAREALKVIEFSTKS